MRDLERAYILHLLARHGGHRGRTAEALGIDRRTLYRKLKEYESDDG
ncbi:MAG: helix-turn-helix domain-containing protein [Gemmatimonadota bacterium]